MRGPRARTEAPIPVPAHACSCTASAASWQSPLQSASPPGGTDTFDPAAGVIQPIMDKVCSARADVLPDLLAALASGGDGARAWLDAFINPDYNCAGGDNSPFQDLFDALIAEVERGEPNAGLK